MLQEMNTQIEMDYSTTVGASCKLDYPQVTCVVKRKNPKTARSEYLLVLDEHRGWTFLSTPVRPLELTVQAARRVIWEKTGLVCVEQIEQKFEISGGLVCSTEISYIQSNLKEQTSDCELMWLEDWQIGKLCKEDLVSEVIGRREA